MIHVHEDGREMAEAVARRIAALAAESVAERGFFRLALAGGGTPKRCYRELAMMDVDWEHVHVYFGDERCLPKGDPGRNDSMARDALISHVPVREENVHPIMAEFGAEEAASRYKLVLEGIRLDLVLLGMGEDGHTASLFPGGAFGSEAVVAVHNAPKPPQDRVSLGLSTINAARGKIFMVSGEGKRSALERILRGEMLPAALVAGAEWHVDRAALPIT